VKPHARSIENEGPRLEVGERTDELVELETEKNQRKERELHVPIVRTTGANVNRHIVRERKNQGDE